MILYYSRLQLNPTHPQVIADARNPYNLHHVTASPFTGRHPELCRVLWRLDGSQVLIQSTQPPNSWDTVLQRDGYLDAPPETKALNVQLRAGQVFAFRLLANPARRVKSHPDAKAPVLALETPEEREQWLKGHLERSGMRLLASQETSRQVVSFRKRDDHRVTLARVLYDGFLAIENPETASAAIAAGIGRAKAFGCGMLSLAPPKRA